MVHSSGLLAFLSICMVLDIESTGLGLKIVCRLSVLIRKAHEQRRGDDHENFSGHKYKWLTRKHQNLSIHCRYATAGGKLSKHSQEKDR